MPYIGNQPGTGVRNRFIYTATASQTTFTGADDNSKTLKYADSNYIDVYLNGVCLEPGTDYTADTKTSVVLTQAASLNDTLKVVAYDVASMDNSLSKSDGGTIEAGVTIKTTDNSTQLTLESTDADATTGPNMSLYRNSASPTDGDQTGSIFFIGKDDPVNDTTYGAITTHIVDSSSGTEDGRLTLSSMKAGTSTETLSVVSGQVGIGTNAPSTQLHITPPNNTTANKITQGFGSARADGSDVVAGGFDSEFVTRDGNVNTGAFIRVLDVNTNGSFPTTVRGGVLSFGTVDGTDGTGTDADEKMRITHAGNVGIGTDSPTAALDVRSKIHVEAASPGAITGFAGQLEMKTTGVGSDVGILMRTAQNSRGIFVDDSDSNTMRFYGGAGAGTSYDVTISNLGNVVIPGSLSKGSGSFKIKHPLESKKDTHWLVHSFVEGPQADNLYRGKVALVDGTATQNIDTVAGMSEGTFAALNREVQCFTTNETGWTAVKGSVSGNILTITAQDDTCTDTISWMVIGERKDEHMMSKHTTWTDSDGKVIIEPELTDKEKSEITDYDPDGDE